MMPTKHSELVYSLDVEIAKLQAENAALREKLDAAIKGAEKAEANKPSTSASAAQKPIAWMVSAERAGSNYLDRYIYWEDNEMLKGHRQAGHAIVALYAVPDVQKQQK